MVSAVSLGTCIHFFPFFPRWLAMKGRDDDCLKALSKLHRLPAEDRRVQLEWHGILNDVKIQQEIKAREHPNSRGVILELKEWFDLFKPKYIRRTIIAVGLPFFQQFSGINAFVLVFICPRTL
jgi:hypothetical protein